MKDYKREKDYVEKKINQHMYDLTFGQQEFIKESWKDKSIIDLARECFKEPELTEKDLEFHNVRKFIAKVKRGVPTIEFNEDQLRFIENNSHIMKPYELAKLLFPNKDVKPLSSETQTVKLYLDALGLNDDDGNKSMEYKSPKSTNVIARKINKADPNANLDVNDLSPLHKNFVNSLKSYLQSMRFNSFINILEDLDLRDFFEEEFIKATYDKPDLNSEELNMYITLCAEYVGQQRLEKQRSLLSAKMDEYLNDKNGGDDGKQLFFEASKIYENRTKELSESKDRATTLQTKLSSTRAQRLDKMAKVNESLSKFIEDWKSEEGRQRALIIAEARNLELQNEMNRLEDSASYIANIMGLGKDELLNI